MAIIAVRNHQHEGREQITFMKISKVLAAAAIGSTLVTMSAVVAPAPVYAAPATLAAANAAIDANMNSLNQQAGELHGQVGDLNATIAGLDAQRAALEPQLAQKQATLRETLRQAYMAGDPSSLEIVAGNQTFSGVVGQQQYRDEIGQKTQEAAKDLSNTKKELDAKIAEAQAKRDGLLVLQGQLQEKIDTATAQAEAKKQLALATQNNEQKYEQIAKQTQQEDLGAVASPSASPSARPSGGGGMVRGNNPYTPGQCTWYVYNQTGRGQQGNAGQWPGGGSRGIGSILIMPPGVGGAGGVGHVGIIVGFSGNGITIRDMNWAGPFVVTTHTVPNSGSYRYL